MAGSHLFSPRLIHLKLNFDGDLFRSNYFCQQLKTDLNCSGKARVFYTNCDYDWDLLIGLKPEQN